MLTEAAIRDCADDEALFKLLSGELQRNFPDGEDDDLDVFLERLRRVPVGLRAMAASYQLDVSITLDDFGWHFANWHHRGYCEETLWALRELGAAEEAALFEQAYALAQPYWDEIGALLDKDFDAFVKWYWRSPLEQALMPLNDRMWDIARGQDGKWDGGILSCWPRYARAHPERVVERSRSV